MVGQIYPTELQLNKANSSDTEAPFLFCLVFAMSLCASVYICFVVTCWERADLLALVCGAFCEFVTFPLVSCVKCGT